MPEDFVNNISAVISRDNLIHNVKKIAQLSKTKNIMAVVKADAYGHGAVKVASIILKNGVTHLGVATLDEGIALREAGISAPITAWLFNPWDDVETAVKLNITIGVSNLIQLDFLSRISKKLNYPVKVEVKLDTGLNRNGFGDDNWDLIIDSLIKATHNNLIVIEGTFSHLAHADSPTHPMIDQQYKKFLTKVNLLRDRDIDLGQLHIANSAATLSRPDLHLDRVRPGIAIYGFNPISKKSEGYTDVDLRPVLQLETILANVKRIPKGSGVSYGHDWISQKDTIVGLLPVGYADGILRSLGGKIRVMINGKSYDQVGRISMDQCVIDLKDDDLKIGDHVTLFGDSLDGSMTATDWADIAGTIDYEILTMIRGRVKRVYR